MAGVLTACGQTTLESVGLQKFPAALLLEIGMSNYQSHLRDYWQEPSSTSFFFVRFFA